MGALPIVGGIAGGLALNKAGNDKKNQYLSQQQAVTKPEDIKFTGLGDQAGNLQDRFKLSGGEDYSRIAGEKLQLGTQDARDIAAKQAGTQEAMARQNLASRGGLSGGAAAILARQGQQSGMDAQQELTRKALGLEQDIASKQFDIGREAEKFNVGNLIGNERALNEFNLSKYANDMAAYGAGQSANAQIRASAPKGGVLGGVGSVLGK